MIPERRRHRRLSARQVPAQLTDRLGDRPLRLIDLGDTGARVETAVWLTPGHHYLLRIAEPAFQITGRVVHARLLRVEPGPDGIRPVFEAGLDFDDAWPAARHELARLMRTLAAMACEQRFPDLHVAAN